MKHILLDTNAWSRFISGDKKVLDFLADAETVHMSVFVLGELLAGFKGGKKELDNRRILDTFLKKSTVKILSATMDTSEFFAQVKDQLRKKGKPIPINDVWIAAHALESGSKLVTFDSHFASVPGLLYTCLET